MNAANHAAVDRETARAQHGHAFAVHCGVPGVQGTGPLVPAKPRRACAALAPIFGKIPPRNEESPRPSHRGLSKTVPPSHLGNEAENRV
jgi:hypothetical protein